MIVIVCLLFMFIFNLLVSIIQCHRENAVGAAFSAGVAGLLFGAVIHTVYIMNAIH